MRSNRAGDYWRRVYKQNFAARVDRLAFEALRGLGTGELSFQGGITALVGANGVGKTTLLEAIHTCLVEDDSHVSPTAARKLAGSRLAVDGEGEGAKGARRWNNDEGSPSRESEFTVIVVFLNPARESARQLRILDETTNLEELLAAYSARRYTGDQLNDVRFVLGKGYDWVESFEIPDFDENEVFPYFRVQLAGEVYGSESMGIGELSLLTLMWRLDSLDENSILLLEEPETFIAPRSQVALLDVVSRVCALSKIWVILTTHSHSIVSRIPKDHIRLLSFDGSTFDVIEGPNEKLLNDSVGLRSRFRGVVLVEDRIACEWCVALFAKLAPDILETLQVKGVGPDGIKKGLNFPAVGPWLSVVGLFDGDMRGKVGATTWPYAFLPSGLPPEECLRSVSATSVERLAEMSGRTAAEVRAIFASLLGTDHHDWLIELSRSLSVSTKQVVHSLNAVWLEDVTNRVAAEEMIKEVRKHAASVLVD